MTHAGEFVRKYCARTSGGQRDFAARAGLTEGHLSKIVHGERRAIREETLSGILRAFPVGEQRGFLLAYMKDVVPEEYAAVLSAETVAEEADELQADPAFRRLTEALQRRFRQPKREAVTEMLVDLVENAGTSPEFLRGLECFAKLRLG